MSTIGTNGDSARLVWINVNVLTGGCAGRLQTFPRTVNMASRRVHGECASEQRESRHIT
jgi:hypothetical protein